MVHRISEIPDPLDDNIEIAAYLLSIVHLIEDYLATYNIEHGRIPDYESKFNPKNIGIRPDVRKITVAVFQAYTVLKAKIRNAHNNTFLRNKTI